ncbi:hydroxysqualene dehydroxylase HpnE [Zavarzinia sp. CC-PAN008]|uniref:hydroxysqualene dehydroxylase HpnE n=1 Tax=Zavarzinia sp. CC-PAN008 TaxID=3243332 RepID=UPI003F74649C
MNGTVHVIGAGLAGLAAAVRLVEGGRRVALYEAAGHAGGRCRTFFDAGLGIEIDNGNHLILGANPAVFSFCRTIGSGDQLLGLPIAFPFVDLATGRRWTLRPGRSRAPLWLFDASRRVPGTRVTDYLDGLHLMTARASATVASRVRRGPLYDRLWEPLTVAVLNASPEEGTARLLGRVFRETFAKGGDACRPYLTRRGLGPALVDPAVAWLEHKGAAIRFNTRLKALDPAALDFGPDGQVALAPGDRVILAVPPPILATLLPGMALPQGSRAIVNVHYRLDQDAAEPSLTGLVGGIAQWVFRRERIASVTVSAADALAEQPAEAIAARVWPEVAAALDLTQDQPPARVIKEKRATFLQTPANEVLRPGTRDVPPWLLAGDFTDTGLPATIEGAIRSGFAAAQAA